MWEYNYDYLCHHGIQGQKWGVRRFQNKDGSLTAAGKKRYNNSQSSPSKKALDALNGSKTYHSVTERLNDATSDTADPSDLYFSKNSEDRQRIRKAIRLAMDITNGNSKPSENEMVEFLYDDADIGRPMIADLMLNKGYSAKQIEQLVNLASQVDEPKTNHNDLTSIAETARYQLVGLNDDPEEQINFANNCERLLNSKRTSNRR